ncbi:sulfatase-like hydrolase/transferase [Fusobacterium varium]|uniref:sulfatase-like hydrolase/transferase n=1 Tax=Fusobacterium varium TaxID=856 RepID=UPI001F3D758B|nr:sulfatase-like hydrolase/transferase [Fusobacterium varium]MCF2674255.1 hypothetical protein [Fusobacterium varium]
MEILFIYLDAIRGDLSNFKNSNIQESELEKFQKKVGGIYYTNAHTVAPNTYQSFATIRTGLSPKKNGCTLMNNVEFLNLNFELFNYLLEKGYNVYILTDPDLESKNTFKNKKLKLYYEFKNLIDDYNKDENTKKTIFYYCLDYHELIAKENTKFQENKARNKIGKILFNSLGEMEEIFDKILIFSDHGFTMRKEINADNLDYFSLDESKTNVILQLRNNKNQRNGLEKNNKLVSLLDIFPTVISWFENEEKYKLDGISLEKSYQKRTLYLEDGFMDATRYFSGMELEKVYKIAIIKENEKKILDIKNLFELKDTSIFKELTENLCHIYSSMQLYQAFYNFKNKPRILIDKNPNIVNDKENIKRYITRGTYIEAQYYLDGSKIEKNDNYMKSCKEICIYEKKKEIKKLKLNIKKLIKESIVLLLIYLNIYENIIKIKHPKH